MNKFKVIIKGDDNGCIIKSKGEDALIIASMMKFVCDCTISNGFSKKNFLERCSKTYDICKEMGSEKDE